MRVLNSLGVAALMSGASMLGCADDTQTTYDIYFLGGQSNMDGYGGMHVLTLQTVINILAVALALRVGMIDRSST